MDATSFAPNFRYEVTCDVTNTAPRKHYNHPSYSDITTIENFLQSPITENGSEYDESMQNADVKISDVIDVIQTDPDFTVPSKLVTFHRAPSAPGDLPMLNQLPASLSSPDLLSGGQRLLQQRAALSAERSNRGAAKRGARGGAVRRSSVPAKPDHRDTFNGDARIPIPHSVMAAQIPQQPIRQQPYVFLLEQPAPKILRFRYLCESRSAGSFPGKSSTPDNPTYPTIQIVGYQGKAIVVVSCVTKDFPHKPHPFNLVSKANNEDYKKGICRMKVDTNENYGVVQFVGMGVQCVKRKEMAASLDVRRTLQVDPFGTGFAHRNQPTAVDLICVRLCFQVFLEGDTPGRFTVPLAPVVSDPVYDKRRATEPKIMKLSDCVSSVAGGKKDIILLCEKVTKNDIQVRFYEENGDWEAFVEFQPSQIHHQYAICFKTPKYKTLDVTEPVKVLVQLRRPSDGATSEPLPFELWPACLMEREPLKHKRKKIEKIEDLRNLHIAAREGRFPQNFFAMDATKREAGSSSSCFAPMTPDGGSTNTLTSHGYSTNPLGSSVSPIYTPNISGSPLGEQMWNFPTPSSSQPSTSTAAQHWNIPSDDLLHPQKSTPVPQPEDLNSGDLKWLMDVVETQRSSLESRNSPANLPPFSQINSSVGRAAGDPNSNDSLSRLDWSEFYRY